MLAYMSIDLTGKVRKTMLMSEKVIVGHILDIKTKMSSKTEEFHFRFLVLSQMTLMENTTSLTLRH